MLGNLEAILYSGTTLPSVECVPLPGQTQHYAAYITEAAASFRGSHPTFTFWHPHFPPRVKKKKIKEVYKLLLSRFGDWIGHFQDCRHLGTPHEILSMDKELKAPCMPIKFFNKY